MTAHSNETAPWMQHQYLVEWVDSVKSWAKNYEIFEFIRADESGEDPSGRIPSMNLSGEFPIDTTLVWTVFDSSSEVVVTTEYTTGMGSSAGAIGWFIGRVSHHDERIVFDYLKRVCSVCEGNMYFENEEGEEECEVCLYEPTHLWLSDTDFELN